MKVVNERSVSNAICEVVKDHLNEIPEDIRDYVKELFMDGSFRKNLNSIIVADDVLPVCIEQQLEVLQTLLMIPADLDIKETAERFRQSEYGMEDISDALSEAAANVVRIIRDFVCED